MSDDCIICGKWPEADHWALREMLEPIATDASPCRRRTHVMTIGTTLGTIAVFTFECLADRPQ
jgi:hypothetical protein